MADNTVYDSVFKTMVHKAPKLMIPFINEVFGRDYPLDAQIVQFNDEHEGPHGTTIDDSVFRLHDKIYHVECQSTPDSSMVVRMIEYDFSIALEEALANGAPYRMEFPASCVLFLRHTASTPDVLTMEVILPDGGSFEYHTKVVKAQRYDADELFQKRLLLLLPYYLLRHEKELARIAVDEGLTKDLLDECGELRMRLSEIASEEWDALLYEGMIELIIRVSDHMMAAYETLQRKVRNAMGGEVLELLNDKAERMAREGLAQGLQQGLKQGIEQGIEQGREKATEENVKTVSQKLSELGVSDDVIAATVAAIRAGQEKPTE